MVKRKEKGITQKKYTKILKAIGADKSKAWTTYRLADDETTYGKSAGHLIIVTADHEKEITGIVYDEVDARLIAAAPETAEERDRLKEINKELLEVLQAIKARLHGEWDNPALVKQGTLSTNPMQDCINFVKAAIAKAEGRT